MYFYDNLQFVFGGVLVPKKWVGKKVKILLLEEVAEEK